MRTKTTRGAVPILLVGFLTASALADPGVVDVTIDREHVQIAAVGEHAFRLSVSPSGMPQRPHTVFLADPNSPAAAAEEMNEGNLVGLKSGAGELVINKRSGEWSLRDADGKVLIPACRVGSSQGGGLRAVEVGGGG